MFLCMIPCAKPTPVDGDEDDRGNGTPNTKDAVKGLTSQIKDLALKLSGKKIKAGTPESIKYDTVSEGGVPYGYIGGGSASSTPALDYTNPNQSPIGNTTPGGRQPQPPAGSVAVVDMTGSNKWIIQMEPGVHITVVSLPTGGNDLKRIRFCRDMFDKPRAQRLWAENYDRIRELHNIQNLNQHVFNTPARSDDDENSGESEQDIPMASMLNTDSTTGNFHAPAGNMGYFHGGISRANNPTDNDVDAEWVEQDDPGVLITVKRSANGTRQIRRIKFSREIFDADAAKDWWLRNRVRVHAQYM
ncbi:protein BREVIS RADIX-like [Gastrolobium bilobum]|uniref:protein BREVIS RADIX-like n=1 Tax=Gastrolobium bilobum TaxID=150636 RepID=UPI002AB06094|nr:protein BREVIS RADIX-like [Gastrolobium bilobum]